MEIPSQPSSRIGDPKSLAARAPSQKAPRGAECLPASREFLDGLPAARHHLTKERIEAMELDANSEDPNSPFSLGTLWHHLWRMEEEASSVGGTLPSRGRGKSKEDKYCGVCGDRALGYNFDAISCESCKAFFRRNAPKGLEYFKCPYDEKCKMDVSNRRFCKRCRLKKCFEIGMRKEYILTEEERLRKRQKIEENRIQKAMVTGTQIPYDDTYEDRGNVTYDFDNQVVVKSENGVVSSSISSNVGSPVSTVRQLLDEDSHIIGELVKAYKSSLNIYVDQSSRPKNCSNMLDIANVAEISVRRVIDMAKKIRAFKLLPQTTQISLLKGGSIELLILRSVLCYDQEKNHFLDPNDDPNQSAMSVSELQQGEGPLFEDHMKFIKSLAMDLKADETTLILLLVISLFSPDRPGLDNKEYVSQEQDKYSMLLQRYLESRYPSQHAKWLYPKLLMKLTDIRNLNEDHSQVMLKVNPEGIQPLMKEVLDLNNGDRSEPTTPITPMTPPT